MGGLGDLDLLPLGLRQRWPAGCSQTLFVDVRHVSPCYQS